MALQEVSELMLFNSPGITSAQKSQGCAAPQILNWSNLWAQNKSLITPRRTFTQSGQTYDVIFDAVGKISLSEVKDILAENGILSHCSNDYQGNPSRILRILKDLFEKGKIKPVIDKRFPLEQIADAHRYVETGRKKGNVVITLNQS